MTAPILVPDAGPLITLAYANKLDVLKTPNWPIHIVDMVLHEVTRNRTPTNEMITTFVNANKLTIISTEVYHSYQERLAVAETDSPPRKTGLGELAIQEYMIRLDLEQVDNPSVFLFEDHKIARATFHLPEQAQRISTRAFLIFLEEKGWIESAADIERTALLNGRHFSQLRFPAK